MLHALVDLLPRLRSVTLRDCVWQSSRGVDLDRCMISRAISLKIESFLLEHAGVLDPLQCFQHITSLVVSGQQNGLSLQFPPAPTFVPRIDALVADNCSQDFTRTFLDHTLLSMVDTQTLRGITLSKPPGYYIEMSLCKLTELEELDFVVFYVPRKSLNVFPNLRNLTVRVNLCASSSHPWSHTWPALIGTLVQCATPTVTTLGVGLQLYGSCPYGCSPELEVEELCSFLESLDWASLRSVVPRYEHLHTLRVSMVTERALEGTRWIDKVREVVIKQLQAPEQYTLDVVEGHDIGYNQYAGGSFGV